MNNGNNTSSCLWAQRLFKQTGARLTLPQGKVYFTHRNHLEVTGLRQSPFSALFGGAESSSVSVDAYTGDIQPFNNEPSHVTDYRNTVADAQIGDANLSTQLTVLNTYNETPDTKTFRLGKLGGSLFDYLPGQYITLSVLIAGQTYKRSYSLASCPGHANIVEITVKRAEGGLVSNWLNEHLNIGDSLTVKGPFGKFTCANQPHEKILLLAAGSGVVPIMSMLRWLADTEAAVDVALLLSFRTPEDIIYADELKLIAARHKNINLAVTLTTDDIANRQWSGLTGRINTTMISAKVSDVSERRVYLCGPEAFMAACKKHLLQLAVPAEKILCESFNASSPAVKTQASSIGNPMTKKTGDYRIRFVKSGKTVAADGQLTLLELAEKSGVAMGYECRAGNCGECMVKCLKGKVQMTGQAEIAGSDRKKGWVYACCAYPASDVVLDI
jgi:ferredoxin-NADP reductase